MDETSLRRFFRRVVLASIPLPLAVSGVACGSGTGINVIGGDGAGGSGEAGSGGSGGSDSSGGSAGSVLTAAGGSIGQGGNGPGGSVGVGGFAGGGDPCVNYRGSGCASCKILDEAATRLPDGGLPDCHSLCGTTISCTFLQNPGQPLALYCQYSCVTGRRPAGLEDLVPVEAGSVGGYFAEIAFLEAASVDAFRVLAAELRHHGAPASLVRAAERAARDEVRHARITRALARRYGSNPARPRVEKRSVRPLEEVALENATEGCVRETFGALLATFQAEASKDPVVRAAFLRIAKDETRHAALAWRVAAWIEQRLDGDARARIHEARRVASDDLVATAAIDSGHELTDIAGLPAAYVAAQMAREMKATLWAGASAE